MSETTNHHNQTETPPFVFPPKPEQKCVNSSCNVNLIYIYAWYSTGLKILVVDTESKMYSLRTSLIILCMIVTGATRSVGVKLFYQLGFESPLFVTILYLMGQSLSMVAYWLSHSKHFYWAEDEDDHDSGNVVEYAPLSPQDDEDASTTLNGGNTKELSELELQVMPFNQDNNSNNLKPQQFTQVPQDDDAKTQEDDKTENFDDGNPGVFVVPLSPDASSEHIAQMVDHSIDRHGSYSERKSISMPLKLQDQFDDEAAKDPEALLLPRTHSLPLDGTPPSLVRPQRLRRRGSKTGLTQASTEAVAWIHSIPWQLKPALPGFFNLCNAALRWGSLVYVAASICDMLMSGTELVLSVVAARVIRKRQISGTRWAGVAVVAVGLLTVRAADVLDSNAELATLDPDEAANLKRDHFIGAVLIVGQSLTAICQDMSEELFLQEADFPATLLLGMEGMFGLVFGIPLYLMYAPETPGETWDTLQESSLKKFYVLGLVCLFTVTGIFNIMATSVTSSMTRNMWKNFRTILVWVMGLVIFYGIGNADLGEAWIIPDSFFTLFGFAIMLSGIYVYYKNK